MDSLARETGGLPLPHTRARSILLAPLLAGLAALGMGRAEQHAIAGSLLDEADPRLGIRRTAEIALRTLGQRFDADVGLLLAWLPNNEPCVLKYGADGKVGALTGRAAAPFIDLLAALPSGTAGLRRPMRLFGAFAERFDRGFRPSDDGPSSTARDALDTLADTLASRSLVAVPLCPRAPHPYRLVLGSDRRRYGARAAAMLLRVAERLGPVIQNAALLERLADEAMATERARIGRDLHDNAVQPYLGLKYGIEALARKAREDNPLYDDIQALHEMAVGELHYLRELVSGMRCAGGGADNALEPALRRQAQRFTELFGLDVSVHCRLEAPVSRQLAAAIYPMIAEALTNIRRHTPAAEAEIIVAERAGELLLRITNPHDPAYPPAAFLPRSIVERTESIGGRAVVELQQPGLTALMIAIPKFTESA